MNPTPIGGDPGAQDTTRLMVTAVMMVTLYGVWSFFFAPKPDPSRYAVDAGVVSIDASIGGIGGCPFAPAATGNIPTDDLVYMLSRSGIETGVSLDRVIAASRWLEEELGRAVPAMLPKAGSFPPAA